jgi:hypothetical protein
MRWVDGVDRAKCRAELDQLERQKDNKILENRRKQEEVLKKLKLLTSVENARLQQDYYMRAVEESQIAPEEKERA